MKNIELAPNLNVYITELGDNLYNVLINYSVTWNGKTESDTYSTTCDSNGDILEHAAISNHSEEMQELTIRTKSISSFKQCRSESS